MSTTRVRLLRRDVRAADARLSNIFAALGDPGRYRIFQLLMRREDLCVTDVANVLGVSVPAASQQLRVMEVSGLVTRERMGQMTCYTLRTDDPVVKAVMKIIRHS